MRCTVKGSSSQRTPQPAWLDEPGARRLCLLQACEDGPADPALWSPEDAAWASRLADETAGPGASDAQWLAERARHAMERLFPRRASLARAFGGGRVRRAAGWAALGGLAFGVVADVVGHAQLIDLLAAPVWAVVAWNMLVYVWILVHALRGLPGGASQATDPQAGSPGPMRRAAQRWLAGAGARRGVQAGTPEQRFAARWAAVAAPLAAGRAAALLHLAAAALAVGLVAGLYARALVLDYRVGWQSTLLEPAQVHALLSVLLAPASAMTGLPVPDVQAVAALRTAGAGAVPATGAATGAFGAAAHWVHLLAATLAWAVVVPRLLLALRAAAAARWRARRLTLALDDAATLRRLATRRRHAGAAAGALVLQVLPHGFTPVPAAAIGLQRLLAACFGEQVVLRIEPPTPYGDEDRALPAPPAGAPWRVAWFELAATPEPQVQGRFLAQLAGARRLLLVDESSYRQRLGAASPRLAERRRAWQALADEAGVAVAFADLERVAADPGALAGARAALETALDAPRAAA